MQSEQCDSGSDTEKDGHDSGKSISCYQEYKHMVAYSLMLSTCGALETFSSALFVDFEDRLEVTEKDIALIFTVKSISFGLSSIFCAFIIDFFDNTHPFVALSIFFSSIAITLIPYINVLSVMYILFIFIGYTLGIICVCLSVYIFRKYPKKQDKMMYIVTILYGITKTVFPIIIQLSITLTGHYKYSLFIITFISLLSCISLLLLATPKHDNLRTIKQLNQRKSTHEMALMLSTDRKLICIQWIMIFLLSFIMASFSATQSGLVNFIAVYCDEYLFISDSTARYMISAYFGGQLFYRIVVAVALSNKKVQKILIPKKTIPTGFVIMTIFLIFFLVFDKIVVLIFVVYTVCGIFASCVYPDLFTWCEQMAPVSGVFSCLFTAGFAGGDAIIVFIIGELFDSFGPRVLPYSLLIAVIIGTLLVFIAIVLYKTYDKHKTAILHS